MCDRTIYRPLENKCKFQERTDNCNGTNGFSQGAQGLNRKERKTTRLCIIYAFVLAVLRSLIESRSSLSAPLAGEVLKGKGGGRSRLCRLPFLPFVRLSL
jgi:hypothetical protein